MFSYKQVNVEDSTFLGSVVFPADITRDGLNKMDSQCARSYTDNDFVQYTLASIKDGTTSSIAEGWASATQHFYFDPAGIESSVPFSLNADTVQDIVHRNPSLRHQQFVVLSDTDRPFPIIGTALVGPTEGAGYTFDNRNFTMLEISPLHVGQMRTLQVGYSYHTATDKLRYSTVGGAVEPFAFGRFGEAPPLGLQEGEGSGMVHVPEPSAVLDLQWAAGASGYAEGAFFESLRPHNISSRLGMHFDYWSPSDRRPSSKDTLFCDGGSYENIMLPSMLQRGVRKIVLFFNPVTPLQPSSSWNVLTDAPSKTQIDDGFSSLFGVLPEDYVKWEQRSFDFSKDQFFSSADYAPTVLALQAAQQAGNGIIYTANLTTVQNDWWGIPAGVTAEVTFVYLGRLKNWESELSDEMRALLVPAGEDAEDLSKTIEDGPFRHFPHYPTSGGLLNAEQANVLADMTGWLIHKNADLFKSIFAYSE